MRFAGAWENLERREKFTPKATSTGRKPIPEIDQQLYDKSAIMREQNEDCFNSAEREQLRQRQISVNIDQLRKAVAKDNKSPHF